MTERGRRSILGLILPDSSIDANDRRAIIGIYGFSTISGWVGKIIGKNSSDIYKINGILRSSIVRVIGK